MMIFPYQSNLQGPASQFVGAETIDPLLGGTSAATTATLSGPTGGTVGIPTASFSVSMDGIYMGTATPSDSGAGGTFSPVAVGWSNTSTTMMFTYTPGQAGTIPISITANPVLAIAGSPINLVVAAGPGTISVYVDPRAGTIIL